MALIQAKLAGDLTRILQNPGSNAAEKAVEWANAYFSYAASVMAGVLVPTFLGIEQPAFLSKILPVFSNPQGTSIQFAEALTSAVEAFWLLPPVLFTGPGVAGAVTAFPGRLTLPLQLSGILSRRYKEVVSPARDIAMALDVATRTVVVTFAPPPGSIATLL